ncbi:Hercynine oxygenase [Diplonema papillatum]|nr:Hercynine oxygenase [Diplonema papillatum]
MSNTEVRSTTASGSVVYESARAVEEYLQFHFGGDRCMPYGFGPKDALHFAQRCGQIAARHALEGKRGTAVDMGCAVGGSAFELSKSFARVTGVDFSQAFIDAANKLKATGTHAYKSTRIADIRDEQVATLPAGTLPEKCTFTQGDACTYAYPEGPIDCIVAANLLCRLPDPKAFLAKATDALSQGGILVLVSPFSWLSEYTEKAQWLGGKYDDAGAAVDSAEVVIEILSQKLELVYRGDEPFLIREHVRKFQYGVSDCMVWRKK